MATYLNETAQAVRDRMGGIWDVCDQHREDRADARRAPSLIRIWDGDWNYIGTVHDALEYAFTWRLNDTGPGHLEMPTSSWLAKWVMDHRGRETKNVHITMDRQGSRWSGRLDRMVISKQEDGQRSLNLEFLHDYEELKHIYVWPNPYLPAAVQFPRAFILVGPTAWALKTALFMNVHRLEGNLWALPDDPFDLAEWDDFLRPNQWAVQVAPSKAILSDTSPWTVLSSRMKNWHDLAAPKLADAHLMVTTRRWLTGDPDPWPDANLRNGALIVDIVDKSGFWSTQGTATFGDIWKGLVRTIQEVVGHVDTESTILPDPIDPPEYKVPGVFRTTPDAPYVVYRDGPLTGVTASDFTWEPAKDVQVVTGGHSMPGVNEAISATIKLVGNYVGAVIGLFSAGSIADTVLAPIYSDTILAWQSIKSLDRSRSLGWSHYYEHFADGADNAYTLNSVIALRQGFWETRERTSHQIKVEDGAPWFVGEGDSGHFFLGDRIGSTIEGLPDGLIVVEQVTELTYKETRGELGWEITCGDRSSQQSPLESVLGKVRNALGALHDLGVL
jgi:hypothetical protein